MITVTGKGDAICRRAIGKGSSATISFNKMIEQFVIDPMTMTPRRECYIVCSDDLVNKRVMQQFEEAAAHKHPNTKIIFVNKQTKPMYQEGCPGVDIVLQKPTDTAFKQAIEQIVTGEISASQQREVGNASIEKIRQTPKTAENAYKLSRERAKKPERRQGKVTVSVTGMPILAVEGKALLISHATDDNGEPVVPPKYYAVDNKGEFMPTYDDGAPIETDEYGNILDENIVLDDEGTPVTDEDGYVELVDPNNDQHTTTAEDILGTDVNGIKTYDEVEADQNKVEATGQDIDAPVIPQPVETPAASAPKSDLLDALNETNKVADVTALFREMNASSVIKDLIINNSTYNGIEEKLKSIRDAVYVIMNDKSYATMEERCSKIRALMHDKTFYNAAGNTMIEQLTNEIVDIVVSKVEKSGNDRIDEIDAAIKKTASKGWEQGQPAMLAALTDQRASIITELASLEYDVRDIMLTTDGFLRDVGNEIAQRTQSISDNEDINLWFQGRGTEVIDEVSLVALQKLLQTSSEVPEKYETLITRIKTEQALLRKLLQVEDEIYEAQSKIIQRMKERGVEGAIVCQTLLKKSLNIFVGSDNVGKTILPYLYAKYKSKQNCNVLLMNLCKNDKFRQYGIEAIPYDQFVTRPVLTEFSVVKASIADDVAAAQQFITVLTKAADYYKYIYVVLDDDQSELFRIIAPDVFSVNYLVDTTPTNLDKTKNFIDHISLDNVAERIFINRCSVNIRPILQRLGKLDSINYQICQVDNIPEITDGSLSGFDPYGISSVTYAFEELLKHVKP